MTDEAAPPLIDALRPLNGGMPTPTCSTCPCMARDGGQMMCTRNPPTLTITTRPAPPPRINTLVQVPVVSHVPVNPTLVCWEHPELQARLRRAVQAAEARMVQRVVFKIGHARVPDYGIGDTESAAVAEADGRKPGDDPT